MIVCAPTPEGLTPMHEAVSLGRKDVVAFLISSGVDVNDPAGQRGDTRAPAWSVLHEAVSHDQARTQICRSWV